MSAKKNEKFLLTSSETEEFLLFLKQNKIKLKEAGKKACMSYAGLRAAILEKRVVRVWRDVIVLEKENQELRATLKELKGLISKS